VLNPKLIAAFRDEFEKIAASHVRLRGSKDRSGRRPLRVDTLLRKEKEGTLYKNTGNEQKIAQLESVLAGRPSGTEATAGKKKGDLPSREEIDTPKREDGRGNAATVPGSGNFLVAPATGGAERSE